MRDRRRLAQASHVAALLKLERLSAAASLADALGAEALRQNEERAADARKDDLMDDWRACLQARRIEPSLVDAAASALEQRITDHAGAVERLQHAVERTRDARNSLNTADMRTTAAAKAAKTLRKRIDRKSEQRAAQAQDDRNALKWSAP